jgi:hypothetical protein
MRPNEVFSKSYIFLNTLQGETLYLLPEKREAAA